MSQRNSETDGMAMGLALVGMAFALLFMVLYAVACFVAIVLTLLALCAWNEPLHLTSKMIITPREARIFIGSGIAGLIGLPVFVIFCAALFHLQIKPDWWGYILLGGYALGALGIGGAILGDEQENGTPNFIASPPALPAPEREETPAPAKPPFRFASWDDEDAR